MLREDALRIELHRTDGTALKEQRAGQYRLGFDAVRFAEMRRLRLIVHARLGGILQEAVDGLDWAEDRDQRRDVVDAHIKADAAALLRNKGHQLPHHVVIPAVLCDAGGDLADHAALHGEARGLDCAPEEGVRRRARYSFFSSAMRTSSCACASSMESTFSV